MLTQYPSQDIIFKVMTTSLEDTGLLVPEETEINISTYLHSISLQSTYDVLQDSILLQLQPSTEQYHRGMKTTCSPPSDFAGAEIKTFYAVISEVLIKY